MKTQEGTSFWKQSGLNVICTFWLVPASARWRPSLESYEWKTSDAAAACCTYAEVRVGVGVGRKLFMQRWPQISWGLKKTLRHTHRIVWRQRQTAHTWRPLEAAWLKRRKIEATLGRIGPLVCMYPKYAIHFSNFFLTGISTFTFITKSLFFKGQRSTNSIEFFDVWVLFFIHYKLMIKSRTKNCVFIHFFISKIDW